MTTDLPMVPSGKPPAWVPNWRDEHAYPAEDYTPYLWAWQFLRRNPVYQADYRSWWDLSDQHEIEERSKELSEKWGVAFLNDPADDNVMVYPDGSEFDQMPPHHLDPELPAALRPPTLEARYPELLWLRVRYQDLAYNLEKAIAETETKGPWIDIWQQPEAVRFIPGKDPDPDVHLFMRFDVRYPIEPQIVKLRHAYSELRTEIEKNRPEAIRNATGPQLAKLLEYLRVFDAVWQGAQRRDIAAVLYPGLEWDPPQGVGPKRIERALTEARRLVRGGYRDLLLWGHWTRRREHSENCE